ncbi:MAG: sulfate adenylyltransferase subunit CysD [Phycisphaerales bacterium]|nr:sulfate adenylyltransferase subunit CysD [Phycisphaerales bacterium]
MPTITYSYTRAVNATSPVAETPLAHLRVLEAESIHIMREVAAEFERPALLFSGGKDSIVMVHLALKAFRPAKFPFPLLHIDTGHNFPEAIEFRDELAKKMGERLIVRYVEDSIKSGRATEDPGPSPSRNRAQIPTLLDAIAEFRFDALFGGARRDEEKARAKERIFSFRDDFGQWDPRNQRPELWNLYNGRIRRSGDAGGDGGGEHIRAFPLSNWTELDVWQYIALEKIEIPSIYFSHQRDIVIRNGQICPVSHFFPVRSGETLVRRTVRFRTVGDMTCTAGVESPASTVQDIIDEIAASRTSERGARLDDTVSDAAMEDRKKEGYF